MDKSIKTNRLVIAWVWGREECRVIANGYGVSFWGDECSKIRL